MNFFLLSSFVVLIAPSSATGPPPHAAGGGRPTTLPATSNVADAVRSNPRGKFVIEGLALRDDEGGNPFNDPSFDISFRATTSFADGAVHIDEDGKSTPISTDSIVLVPDISEQNFFGAIHVNTKTGRSKGFLVVKSGAVGPRGKSYRVTQERTGGKKSTMGLEKGNGSFAPPEDWACDVVGRGRGDARDLTTGDEVHRHRHHHHHEDEEDATNVIVGGALDHMGKSLGLRGANRPRRQLLVNQSAYYTDNYPDMYSYEVEIYMEYDIYLLNNTGGTAQDVEDYINTLNAAVSSIYKYEVDTRITISALEYTDRYDRDSDTSRALNTMQSQWAGSNFGNGNTGIDLHHALLGNDLGGGIAYLGVVCDSQYGMGLSANMDANFANIDDPAGLVWDLNVYAHEVGHNFNADHTHTWPTGANVDTCGNNGGCPNELDGSSIGKATIMSYCHQCPGGESNMGPTFGGHRDFQSPHHWLNENTLGAFNVDPHRVPETMYNHVSNLEACVNAGAVPKQTCNNSIVEIDEDCEVGYTGTCGTISSLLTGTLSCYGCAYDLSGCVGCGNDSLDSGEVCDTNDFGTETCETQGFSEGGSLSCSSDCLNIDTSGCLTVFMTEPGIEGRKNQADVTFEIPITGATSSIKFAISGGSGDADLYVKYGTAPTTGSYDCRPYTTGNNEACTYSSSNGNDQGMYYVRIRAYRHYSGVTLTVSTVDTATTTTTIPTSTPTSSPTAAPTSSPTAAPQQPTSAPTKNPTESPSKPPTNSPSTPPTSQPTAAPQQPGTPSPTGAPTKNPTESPSKPPSNSPSTPPTSQPTAAPQSGTPSPTGAPTKSPTESPSKPPTNSPSTPPTSQPPCSGLEPSTPCDHRGSCVEISGDCCTECCAGEFTGSGNSKVCA